MLPSKAGRVQSVGRWFSLLGRGAALFNKNHRGPAVRFSRRPAHTKLSRQRDNCIFLAVLDCSTTGLNTIYSNNGATAGRPPDRSRIARFSDRLMVARLEPWWLPWLSPWTPCRPFYFNSEKVVDRIQRWRLLKYCLKFNYHREAIRNGHLYWYALKICSRMEAGIRKDRKRVW